jgi:8-oxo-dGTP pyrophosphatase MutT (NUDIX family)
MAPPPPPEGGFTFTHQPSVAALNIPAKEFTSTRKFISAAATGALVFSKATGEDRVLLIQRAAHDSMPLRWEIPGGACDPEDETVLHGLARELWEEAGLRLKNVERQVGQEDVFLTRKGLAVAKVTFEVEVETPTPAASEGDGGAVKEALPEVVLDPNEHARFLWATEEECRLGKVTVLSDSGENEVVDIPFTKKIQRETILLGFKLRREATTNE